MAHCAIVCRAVIVFSLVTGSLCKSPYWRKSSRDFQRNSYQNCWAQNEDSHMDFLPLANNKFQYYDNKTFLTALVSLCDSVVIADGSVDIKAGSTTSLAVEGAQPPYNVAGNEVILQNFGWFNIIQGAIASTASSALIANIGDFLAEYKYGDSGAPCLDTPRATDLVHFCIGRSNCTNGRQCTSAEIAQDGGCICSVTKHTNCKAKIEILTNCDFVDDVNTSFYVQMGIWLFTAGILFYVVFMLGREYRGKEARCSAARSLFWWCAGYTPEKSSSNTMGNDVPMDSGRPGLIARLCRGEGTLKERRERDMGTDSTGLVLTTGSVNLEKRIFDNV